MDEKSLEMLEFPQIREILAGYTTFSVGRELALSLTPLSDYEAVSQRLKQSAEARYLLSIDPGFTTSGAFDVREAVSLASRGKILEPARLVEVQQTLATMRQVRNRLNGVAGEVPQLWEIARPIADFHTVEREIGRCLSPGGEILDRASPQLAAIRTQLKEARQGLLERLEGIMRSPRGRKIVQEPIITERGGRYVIPVKAEFRKDIKGITHDLSNTGASVYVEPWSTVEMGNTMRELVTAEKREVERVLRNLSLEVGAREAEILAGVERLAELDMIMAKARYAHEVKATEPGLVSFAGEAGGSGSGASIKLVEARHPLLGRQAVPLSVEIGRDFSALVITGPNTGGKTVALKTIGLLALMAQAGIPIPAAPETRLPVFDGVYADIGDEQSIAQTLSSFGWHMGNIVRIIRNATRWSLVLLDELGTSTDPAEGSALARAILRYFLASGIMTVATTHYSDLKAFAHQTPGMQNASFDFDPATLTPTYHLTVGIPGGSNALTMAARLGVPDSIISEAKEMMSQGVLDLDAALADITAERHKISEFSRLLEKEQREAKTRNAELVEKLDQLRREERRVVAEARDKVVQEAAELRRQLRQASAALRRQGTKEAIDAARKALTGVHQQLDEGTWAPPAVETEQEMPVAVGDTVYLKGMNWPATVLAISEGKQEIEVRAGQITLWVSLDSVEKVSTATVEQPVVGDSATRPPARITAARLDLRGKRADEVEVLLDTYLNDATLANLGEVQIIHGIGTGTVRQLVRDFLATHPLAKSFRSGNSEEGRDGVTVVTL